MRSQRSGFTLMELMLVLAILVMVAVLSYPSLEAMYTHVKLEAAGDFLVSQFATGRAHAIEEQRVYRFAIQPGSGQFRLAPDQPEFWGGDPSAANAPQDDGTPPPITLEDSLPDGITFGSIDPTAQVVAGSPDQGSWVTILLFLPNGGCSDDQTITLTPTAGGSQVQVRVRGVTGTVTVKTLSPGGK